MIFEIANNDIKVCQWYCEGEPDTDDEMEEDEIEELLCEDNIVFCNTCFHNRGMMTIYDTYFIGSASCRQLPICSNCHIHANGLCFHMTMLKDTLEEQGLSEYMIDTAKETVYKLVGLSNDPQLSLIGRHINLTREKDVICSLVEDISTLIYSLIRSRNSLDRFVAICTFQKMRGNKMDMTAMLCTALLEIANLNASKRPIHVHLDLVEQNEEMFADLRTHLDNYERLRSAPIFKKLYKFGMYAMSLSLFDSFGLTFEKMHYSKIETAALKRKFCAGPDMLHCLLDTLLFLCERGFQCMKTGNLEPLYHAGSKYDEWVQLAHKLKLQSNFLSNPTPHGINKFTFIAELRDSIEKGEAIQRYASKLEASEKKIVLGLLNDLKMIQATEITRRAAQRDRKTPFCLLIHGGSSIGKSSFTSILHTHFAKLYDLPLGSEYKYTRNPYDAFWSGFNTQQWCILMDDIAFMKPGGEMDPSLLEMLQLNNNVPVVPPQADIADKGRTPVWADLVIGSTNAMDLNTHAYFSCPLAVNRRFPYIVNLYPKKEYAKFECMLDPTKVPPVQPGCYPDIWEIQVMRVEPANSRAKPTGAMAKFTPIARYTDIYTFLDWFHTVTTEHRNVQEKLMSTLNDLNDVKLCPQCKRPIVHCNCSIPYWLHNTTGISPELREKLERIHLENQATQEQTLSTVDEESSSYSSAESIDSEEIDDILTPRPVLPPIDLEVLNAQSTYYRFKLWLFTKICTYANVMIFGFFLECFFGDTWKWRLGRYLFTDLTTMRIIMKIAGNRVRSFIGTHPVQLQIVKALCITGGFMVLVKILCKMIPCWSEKPQEQGVSDSIGVKPEAVFSERKAYYYHDPYSVSQLDVSQTSRAYQAGDLLKRKILGNSATIKTWDGVEHNEKGQFLYRYNCATNISGHIWMVNAHALPPSETFFLDIIVTTPADTVTSNQSNIKVTPNMYLIIPNSDVAFIELKQRPPGYRLSEYFAGPELRGIFSGVYLGTDRTGMKIINPVECIKFGAYDRKTHVVNAWWGKPRTDTVKGQCGMLLYTETSVGPVILGMHVAGAPNTCVSLFITRDMIQLAIDKFGKGLERNKIPISAPSAPRELSDLNKKSSVLFTQQGHANVYGSFTGFRMQPKSNVQDTYIRQAVEKRGYVCKTDKPCMDYRPWWIALQDMANTNVSLNSDQLAKVTQEFIHDIHDQLPQSEIDRIVVLDNDTTLNGAPNTPYIEKMNRRTSAGAPYKKSKMHFLIPQQDDPTRMDFSPEIMERIDEIITTYHNGKRFNPQFCGTPKDEPLSQKKIKSGKTRIFCAAEVAWSFVVRKYLLSVIAVIQSNREIFNAAVGVVAQSREWEQTMLYVTKHGKDRMVAGDYAAYDKKMSSIVILAAFDVILDLCVRAGYSEQDLLVVRGIAVDTAFPHVDYNGDLIEFFGTNPSGHPLTVIINGLANVLYMRVAFDELRPDGFTDPFYQCVALMTYGDDNVMSVRNDCDWFNHTTIQYVLAQNNITYTMAEKEAKSVPFIHANDVSFLKRKWRYDPDVQAVLAPLEEDSIHKMLTKCVPGKTITPKAQAVAVISTALREYFFYGREIFEEKTLLFKEIVAECELEDYVDDSTFPTWESLKNTFWDNSSHVYL
jgi:hypothetical protein